MRLEYLLTLGLIIVGTICAILLWYDIKKGKTIKQLEKEKKAYHQAANDYYNADAVAAMNGK